MKFEDKIEEEMKLPEGFKEQIRDLLGEEAEDFFLAMHHAPEVSVKLNRRKSTDSRELGYSGIEPVKWCKSGYYLPERPVFTLNPLLHAGVFYVQDASSMIYEAIVERIVPMAFDTGKAPAVADLCAAPGGKTTSIINALPDTAFVLANEFMPARARILKENLFKWGYPEIMITNSPVAKIAEAGPAFDIVAVDAPCSGEGMMRKEEAAIQQWSTGLIHSCAKLQREILENACRMLKPGGFMIYSTCTFNRQENEEQVEWLVNEKGMVAFDPDFPEEWGIRKGIATDIPCFRFMPHHTRGEGLFVAVMRKETDEYEKTVSTPALRAWLKKNVKVLADGLPLEQVKGRDRVPTSESVLSTNFRRGSIPEVEVDEPTALSYLRHEALKLPENTPRGLVVITFKNHPLGLVKNIGNRANNLYPSDWKIRML